MCSGAIIASLSRPTICEVCGMSSFSEHLVGGPDIHSISWSLVSRSPRATPRLGPGPQPAAGQPEHVDQDTRVASGTRVVQADEADLLRRVAAGGSRRGIGDGIRPSVVNPVAQKRLGTWPFQVGLGR